VEHLFASLEQSALGDAMRTWRWLYPIVNTAHIAGIALLFGSIVALDLRYLGMWKSVGADGLARVLVPMAVSGFVLALFAGGLLFTTDARKYADMPLFQVKIALISLGVMNAVYLARKRATVRIALISLATWTGALICGRFIGYL
jgi:hypothetical protein